MTADNSVQITATIHDFDPSTGHITLCRKGQLALVLVANLAEVDAHDLIIAYHLADPVQVILDPDSRGLQDCRLVDNDATLAHRVARHPQPDLATHNIRHCALWQVHINSWHNTLVTLWADDSLSITTFKADQNTGALRHGRTLAFNSLRETMVRPDHEPISRDSIAACLKVIDQVITDGTNIQPFVATQTVLYPAKYAIETLFS